MAELSSCLVCKSDNVNSLTSYSKAFLSKCKSCGFVFSSKIPTEQELINFYNEYGRDDYLSPITIKRYNELLDTFERFRKTNKLLDVGSGIGYFLEQAKQRGWDVYGTEFTDKAIEICSNKGITMHKGAFNPENYTHSFDVITSFEVIEHINNPSEEIENYAKVLRKDGLFYCTTPNFNSISRRLLKSKWTSICYPEHLSYYTVKTLSLLLKNHRISPFIKLTTGVSLSILQSSLGIKNQKSVGEDSDDENLRRQMEDKRIFKAIKCLLNNCLSLFRFGDTIKMFARKI